MDRRLSSYITLGLAWLFLIFLLLRPHDPGSAKEASWLKSFFKAPYQPVISLHGSAESSLDGLADLAMKSKREALKEIEALQSENLRLQTELLQLKEVQRENHRLEKLLELKSRSPWKLKTARVIGREPTGWWKEVLINFTKSDGAQPLLPVITAEGLVGRISSVEENFSRVTLLGSPQLQVAAMSVESRASGVLGMSKEESYSMDILELDFLKRDSGVQAGHEIVTSGLGGIFPPGIPVGVTLKVGPRMEGLYYSAKVQMHARTDRLEEVCIVLP
jgi:rod shape-determining protein MreC